MRYFLTFLLLNSFLFAGEVLTIKQDDTAYELGSRIDYYVDKENSLSLEEVAKKEFLSHHKAIPNFGFSEPTYWFKLEFNYDKSMKDKQWWLSINYALLDFVDIFVFDADKNMIFHKKSGDLNSETLRDVNQNNLLFSLPRDSLQTYTLYLKVQTTGSMFVPMQIISSKPLIETTHLNQTITGMYYGILLILILYNSITFLYTREKVYVLYVMFVISYALWQLSFDGLGILYIWEDYPWMKEKVLYFLFLQVHFYFCYLASLF